MKSEVLFRLKGKDSFYNIWHTSTVNMILLVNNGEGSLVTGERNYPLSQGAICFVGGDKLHYTLPDQPEIYERCKVNVSPAALKKLLELLPEEMKLSGMFSQSSVAWAKLGEKDAAEAEQIFCQMNEAAKDSVCGEAIILAGYLRLLVMIYKNSGQEVSPSAGLLQQAVEYINRNISRNVTIDEICAAVHISKYHFCRKFKETTGYTVMKYILKTRLIIARDLLKNTRYSVERVCEMSGFVSPAYFCRVFKEETGLTPLAYRKSQI